MKTVIALVALTLACGTEPHKSQPQNQPDSGTSAAPAAGSTPTETSTSFHVSDASSLPPCNSGHAEDIAYVASTKSLMTCDGTQWSAVDAVSQDSVMSSLSCSGPLTGSIFGSGYQFGFSSQTLASGDTWSQASIACAAGACSGWTVSENSNLTMSGASPTVSIVGGQWQNSAWKFSVANTTLTVSFSGAGYPAQAWTANCTQTDN